MNARHFAQSDNGVESSRESRDYSKRRTSAFEAAAGASRIGVCSARALLSGGCCCSLERAVCAGCSPIENEKELKLGASRKRKTTEEKREEKTGRRAQDLRLKA